MQKLIDLMRFMVGMADMDEEASPVTWDGYAIGPVPKGMWAGNLVGFLVVASLSYCYVPMPPDVGLVGTVVGGAILGYLGGVLTYGPLMTEVNWFVYSVIRKKTLSCG